MRLARAGGLAIVRLATRPATKAVAAVVGKPAGFVYSRHRRITGTRSAEAASVLPRSPRAAFTICRRGRLGIRTRRRQRKGKGADPRSSGRLLVDPPRRTRPDDKAKPGLSMRSRRYRALAEGVRGCTEAP